MNLKKHFLMAAAALAITTTAAQAQTKLAVVDLGKVFKEYWRTKQSDDSLKARASEFEKVGKGMQEDFKKAQEDLKTLQESANDQAVSQEERDKRKKELEKKGAALQELYASLQTFDRNARESLAGQQKRLRDSVLRDIRGVVEERSKANSYAVVLDTSSQIPDQTPVVLYTSLLGGSDDLTEAVIKQLNANAPADGGAGAGGAGAAKPEDKEKEKEKK